MSSQYLLVHAAAYALLIDAETVVRVDEDPVAPDGIVDLNRALGSEGAAVVVTCGLGGRTVRLGVERVAGIVVLGSDAFARLPGLVAAAAGQDIDAVTVAPVGGAHAFRLRLAG